MALGKHTTLLNANRTFNIGDAVAERPSIPTITARKSFFNAQPCKHGTIVEMEVRKQKSRTAKKGYSERRWALVQWDIRSQPEWVVETRLVHKNELAAHEQLTRLEK